jgi:hypothetical protein
MPYLDFNNLNHKKKKSIKDFQLQKFIFQFVFTQIPTKQPRNLNKPLYAFKKLKKKNNLKSRTFLGERTP